MSSTRRPLARARVARSRIAQQGVVLVITLLAMVVLLIGLAAILRTVDTAGVMVGNMAFRRDLTNRAEQAIVTSKGYLAGGGLTSSDVAGSHYSATKLANGSTGVPAILDNDSTYFATYGTTAEITDSSVSGDGSIKLRYVIDRQCNTGTGAFVTSACEYISSSAATNGVSQDRPPLGSTRPIYRISVRVAGPRNTIAYFQTTYAN